MLSAADLTVIRNTLDHEPTDVELAGFENLWSEHCSYRSTKWLFRTLPTTGKDVLLGPGDDAAIVRFNENIALAISMESHNHPSYVDPQDGAATGDGGIVRDVLSMGARPIALMDPLYFGPLSREKNRYLLDHVVAGIGGYGNCIGVPVVRGDIAFGPGYDGNPLVNVVCVGIVHPSSYITARVKKPGNRLVLIGASTGRDGLGGASFASRDLSEDAEAMVGSLPLLLIVMFLFIAANLAVGITFSTIARNQLQAMQMSFFFFLPSILLSGFMFPYRGMPGWAQTLGEILPLTHFLRIVRGILLKRNGWAEIAPDLWALVAFMLAAMLVALARYRRTLD